MPLVAKLVELARTVGTGECTGKLGDYVAFALEHHPAWALSVGDDAFTNLEARGSERVNRDGDLVLCADPSCSSASILYVRH